MVFHSLHELAIAWIFDPRDLSTFLSISPTNSGCLSFNFLYNVTEFLIGVSPPSFPVSLTLAFSSFSKFEQTTHPSPELLCRGTAHKQDMRTGSKFIMRIHRLCVGSFICSGNIVSPSHPSHSRGCENCVVWFRAHHARAFWLAGRERAPLFHH